MFKTQHRQNRILNSNLPLFTLLCLCCVIYLGFVIDYWFLLFGLLLPFTIRRRKINRYQIVTLVTIGVIFILLIIFANQFSLFSLMKFGQPLRNAIFNFFNKHYEKETSSFIKLILFNVRSKDTWIFYKQTVDLGIVWLICISGFHVSLLSRIIKKIFVKVPKVGKYVNICVIGFYSILLNFSYASIRILLKLSFDWTFKRFNIQSYNRLGFIGLTICLLNPVCFSKYGFLLSFIVSTIVYFVMSLELNNKIIISLTMNVLAFLATIPFVIEMNHKISLLTFINAFVFTYFSSFLFLYFLIFAWMPFMAIIHRGIIIATYVLIGNISFGNIYLNFGSWPIWLDFVYYFVLCSIAKVVYLIVYNNKI